MTIYKKGTKKYAIANRYYRLTHKRKNVKKSSRKVSAYSRLKTNLSKWFYGKMGLLN